MELEAWEIGFKEGQAAAVRAMKIAFNSSPKLCFEKWWVTAALEELEKELRQREETNSQA